MSSDRDIDQPTFYPGIRQAADMPPSPPGLLRMMIVLVLCSAVGYLSFAAPTEAEAPAAAGKEKSEKAGPGGAPAAMPISVAVVPGVEVTEYNEFSGRLRAVEDVDVRPRVSGIVTAVHFKEGDVVQKSAPLFTIDQRPFQATFNTADAAVSAAAAAVKLQQSELKRAKGLLADRAVSQREFDERQNAYDNAAAALKATQAQKELAALDLEFSTVRAPITGRVGRPDISVGNLVRANEDVLTTLQSVNPVYLDFDIDEGTYLRLMKSVRIDNRAADMPVAMALADETGFTREGRIRSFDNQLAGSSGIMRVRAEFDNTDGLLTPGLFARARLGTPEKRRLVVINDAAINTDQSKRFVYVVDEKGTVQYREVKLGALHPQGRIIESGLEPGEKIIVNGLLRARPGMQVTPMVVDMTTLKPAEGGPPPQGPAGKPD